MWFINNMEKEDEYTQDENEKNNNKYKLCCSICSSISDILFIKYI